MTPHSARIVVLPREVASGVITTAVSRGAWGVSIAIIILSFPIVIDVLVARGLVGRALVPILCLVGVLALLVILGRWPSDFTRVLFLAVGGVLSFIYGAALLDADPTLNGDGSFLVNRPLLVLVLVGGGTSRPLLGLLWGVFGYLVSCVVGLAVSVWAGVPFSPGWGPTMALFIYTTAFTAVLLIQAIQTRNVPDLAKLEADTRRMDLEDQFEQRAAAIVHDTVLNDLSVVMNSLGTLDDRARERLRMDVATLADPSWLRESAPEQAISSPDARVRNAMISLVTQFQWRGLTVDVAQDTDLPVLLTPEAESLMMGAIAACLENVLQHAGTSHAELVFSTQPGLVTAMIVDNGVGFDPEHIAADRLGIRTSVIHRIESLGGTVRIWSTQGKGTSVLLSVPVVEGTHAS